MAAEQMTLKGTLKGHQGWVTQIATTPRYPDMIISSSRGEKKHLKNYRIINYYLFYHR